MILHSIYNLPSMQKCRDKKIKIKIKVKGVRDGLSVKGSVFKLIMQS